jgi:hypothetical protein
MRQHPVAARHHEEKDGEFQRIEQHSPGTRNLRSYAGSAVNAQEDAEGRIV